MCVIVLDNGVVYEVCFGRKVNNGWSNGIGFVLFFIVSFVGNGFVDSSSIICVVIVFGIEVFDIVLDFVV